MTDLTAGFLSGTMTGFGIGVLVCVGTALVLRAMADMRRREAERRAEQERYQRDQKRYEAMIDAARAEVHASLERETERPAARVIPFRRVVTRGPYG